MGNDGQEQNQGTDSRRFLQVKNASVVKIDPRKLELVVRAVTDAIVATEQDAMVPGEPPKFADAGDGISRLSITSYANDSMTVCQPNNKLCASYPAGGLDADSEVKKFGAVGCKTSLNPNEIPGSSGDTASQMFAITVPGYEVVKPFTYTLQRSSYDDVRIGSQCRRGMFIRGIKMYENSVGLICASNHVCKSLFFLLTHFILNENL